MTQPASGYTSDEIQTAVASLVQSTIARPIDALGVRRVDVSFGDVQQAAAGVFLLYPNSPFYVVALGCSRAMDLMTAEETILLELLAAVAATGRQVLPIDDVSTLFNAQAALQALQAAAAQRSGVFSSITSLPSYQQFTKNVQQFLAGPGQTIKSQGQVVQTPQQAQAAIPALVTALQAAHAATVTAVTTLAGALDDYNNLNLPSVVASSVIGNAQSLIGSSATSMNALTPTQRLQQVRQVALNLLASQAVVTTFGSLSGPSEFIDIAGTGFAYSDASHLANPAVLESNFGGAFGIITGTNDHLTSTVDGGAPSTITLAPSPLAALVSSLNETYFIIGDGTQPIQSFGGIPDNNIFKVKVAGTTYTATLPVSSPPSPAAVTGTADTTSAGLYGGGGSLNGKTLVITVDGAVTYTVNFTAPANQTALLSQINGVTHTGTPHDAVASISGVFLVITSANDGPGATLVIQASSTSLTQLGFTGGQSAAGINNPTSAASIATAINGVLPAGVIAEAIGSSPQQLRIRCTSPSTQLVPETALEAFADTTVSQNALSTLGFFNGQTSICRRSTADEVAADIASKVTSFTCAAVFTPNSAALSAIPARSDASNANLVVLARAGVTGNTTFVTTTLTFTVTAISQVGALLSGDIIALRSGPTIAYYTVTTVNGASPTGAALNVGDILVATGTVSGTNATGVSAECGPPVPGTKYDSISIPAGVNKGTYYVLSLGVSPIDVLLQETLPLSNPQLTMTVGYGKTYVEFSSKNTTTASAVSINGTAAVLFFTTPPGSVVGSSQWFLLPSTPTSLQVGDLLEYFGTVYNSPDAQYEITGILAGNILQLATPFPDGVVVNFSTTIPVPFGRLRTGKLQGFTTFQTAVNGWLGSLVNQATFFSNMNRLLNQVLVNASPTPAQVNNALNILNQLYAVLSIAGAQANSIAPAATIESILDVYVASAETVPQIDTLIKSFIEKGSDRAIDVLLTGQFSTFFGLTIDQVSYAGTFQAAARAVAMNDLPVRKYNRSEVTTGRLLGQAATPDLEYTANSQSEQMQGEQVTPPGTYGAPSNLGTTTGSQGAGGE